MKCETQPFDIEDKVRQDCYNRGYEQGRKNPAEEIVKYIEKLQKQVKEYQDKIENGTLVELPCKVGDTVFTIDINNRGDRFVNKVKIAEVAILENGFYYSDTLGVWLIEVFLTREEAEKRLEELKHG